MTEVKQSANGRAMEVSASPEDFLTKRLVGAVELVTLRDEDLLRWDQSAWSEMDWTRFDVWDGQDADHPGIGLWSPWDMTGFTGVGDEPVLPTPGGLFLVYVAGRDKWDVVPVIGWVRVPDSPEELELLGGNNRYPERRYPLTPLGVADKLMDVHGERRALRAARWYNDRAEVRPGKGRRIVLDARHRASMRERASGA